LAQDASFEIIIAGRDLIKAEAAVSQLHKLYPDAAVKSIALDWQAEDFVEKLQQCHPDILVHTAGPFQNQHYSVANTCIDLKINYLDLADAREFVSEIKILNEKAKSQEVVVISGASSVPGISSMVIENFAKDFAILREIDFGISPGNQIDRGQATLEAILSNLGKPSQRLEKGLWKTAYGWQNLHRQYYGDNIGLRWHANCDIPDLTLLPEKYPSLKTVVFHVGLELPFLHFMMWSMSWLTRLKLVKDWSKAAKYLLKISHWFDNIGTANSGMMIHLSGSNHRFQPLDITWTLVAEKGDGPNIPIIPAYILIKKISQGHIEPGAQPCVSLFTLEEFEQVALKWHIYYTTQILER
jgi:saccharopine dehydrogenase-like NADP-dependent oxidoreductase